ncbi:MAG: hypothetical protein HQL52_04235 [Magnetococcales bacterium]|nr:hypothetical protein [Magnetococcales bacterium]
MPADTLPRNNDSLGELLIQSSLFSGVTLVSVTVAVAFAKMVDHTLIILEQTFPFLG